jgi:hypothetical protein
VGGWSVTSLSELANGIATQKARQLGLPVYQTQPNQAADPTTAQSQQSTPGAAITALRAR